MPDPAVLPASPLHALCVYAEPLVVGRRVVVLGDATRGLGERFLEMGARVVHHYDPQPARAETASARVPRGLSVHVLPAGEFDVRDGAFDVAVIPDVSDVPASATLLARVRRLLAPGGVALVRSPNAEAPARGRARSGQLDYYELYDLVAMQFAHVRMVGQVPWTGVALAELGRAGGEPDVTVDTQLVTDAAAPEAFIAVCSQEDVCLAEYALVQLPAVPAPDAETTIALGSERAALAAAQLRASLLEAQVEELRAERNREGGAHSDARLALEGELAERLGELQQAEVRALDAVATAERSAAEVRARDEELARLRDRVALGHKELEEERRHRSRLEADLTATRKGAEATVLDLRGKLAALDRLPLLETAVRELEARRRELEVRGREHEVREEELEGVVQELDARGREQGRQLELAGQAREGLEVALARALMELEAARASTEQGDGEAVRAASASARVVELEEAIEGLVAEVDALSHGHGAELGMLEAALRERGRITHALEQELGRRERIILDLVQALEEARTGTGGALPVGDRPAAVAASPELEASLRDLSRRFERARGENEELRQKLDGASLEIARREGEITTTSWRIQELEEQVKRLEDEQSELTMTIPPPGFLNLEREANDVTVLTQRLTSAEDELDLLRQALAQEHDARVRAESGETLERARAEAARQAALVDELTRQIEAQGGPGPNGGGPDDTATGAAG